MSSKRNITYKCPYCDKRLNKENLVIHVGNKHDDMIPENYSAFRLVFDYINKKPSGYNGKCIICGKESGWDEDKGKYNRLCSNPECKKKYIQSFEERMIRSKGVKRISSTAEGQAKMLANRKISGEYKFQDGGVRTFTGTYEKKALEFMDKVMNIKSEDVTTPGPIMEYMFEGKKHIYISDIYYAPYNLIIEVKDGGNNPNNRSMPEYRAKQIAKEKWIIKNTDFNYLRLTNNDFSQLLAVFMELKMEMTNDIPERVIRINEGSNYIKENITNRRKIYNDVINIAKKVLSKMKITKGFKIYTYDKSWNKNDLNDFFDGYENEFVLIWYDAWEFTDNKARDENEYEKFDKVFSELMNNIRKELKRSKIKGTIDVGGDWDDGNINFYLDEFYIEESNNESSLNFKNDGELLDWMHKNIKYSNFTKLKSHDEVLKSKKGSCHDQVMFEYNELKKLGYSPRGLFFIETNDKGQGGRTHSLVYYKKGDSICWFENAWGDMAGINEPEEKSLAGIKRWIKEIHEKESSAKKYPNLVFHTFSISSHKPGETLQQFVDICLGQTNEISYIEESGTIISIYNKKKEIKKLNQELADKINSTDYPWYFLHIEALNNSGIGVVYSISSKVTLYGLDEDPGTDGSKKSSGLFSVANLGNGKLHKLYENEYKNYHINKSKDIDPALRKFTTYNRGAAKTKDVVLKEENEYIEEKYIGSQPDILYNKEAFDSGEINLCFVTGFSGSGKSTLAHGKESDEVEAYELDDILWNHRFSDDNLKEYGDLVYSYFKGPGKKYRVRTKEEFKKLFRFTEENSEASNVNGCTKEFIDHVKEFVKYSISYSKSHKNKKYIIEGVYLYMFFEPSYFKDYAFYIKGTSLLKSTKRALKRDWENNKSNGDSLSKRISKANNKISYTMKNIKYDNPLIDKFINYFKDKPETILGESYIEEISRSDIKSEFLEKGDSCYNLDKWPDQYNILFVTGISGSGKTTLGIDLAKEFNCGRVELDYIGIYYFKKCKEINAYEKYRSKLQKDCPEAVEFFDLNPPEKYGLRDSWADVRDIIEDFCNWFVTKFSNNGKSYIINGAYLYEIFDAGFYYDKPLIIKDINIVKTVFRRVWRKFTTDKKDDNFFHNLERAYKALKTGLSKRYRDTNKDFKSYKKDMDKNAELVESYIEERSIRGDVILYHGSHYDIKNYIEPKNNSYEDADYVFATNDRLFALCYSGNPWHDDLINQCYYNGQLMITEMKPGYLDKIFNTDGYIYTIDRFDTKKFTQRGYSRYISIEKVKYSNKEYIPNVLEEMENSNIEIYRYPNKPKWMKKRLNEDYIEEGFLKSEPDILYNKEAFDNGDINLCFITGHSGSGKSTLAHGQESDIVEVYELDDLQCIADRFTMANLKEYGDLIYTYFKGPGKQFYTTWEKLKEDMTPGKDYEDKLYPGFVAYAIDWAKKHKDKKYILEGVWLFCNDETGKPYFEPSYFKDYAFYIKGTSAVKSKWRAAKRDMKYDMKEESHNRLFWIKSFTKSFFFKNWKWYKIDEKRIQVFRDYFKDKPETVLGESYIEESISNGEYHPIYLISMNYKAPLEKPIKLFTGSEYTHSGLIIDDEFDKIYSFNGNHSKAMSGRFLGGFSVESFSKIESINPNGIMTISVMFIKNKYYEKIVDKINSYKTNNSDTKYNIMGVVGLLAIPPINKMTITKENKMFCSQFVDYMLKYLDIDLTNKASNLVTPKNIANIKNDKVYNLYTGPMKDFDFKKCISMTKNLSKKSDTDYITEYDIIYNDEISIEERSIRGDVILYHGSVDGTYKTIENNSINNGKRFENSRTSSFWFIKKEYAEMFATAELVQTLPNRNKDEIFILIDNDMKTLVDEKYKSRVIDWISKNDCYVYAKLMNGKYITGGQGRNFPEYTLEFPVKPDNVSKVSFESKINSVKFVSRSYIDSVIEKYKKNKMTYGNSLFGQMIDNILYNSHQDIIQNKRDIKRFNEDYIEESDNNISYDNSFNNVKKVTDSLSKKELSNICNNEKFTDSPYTIYQEVLLVNKNPAAFVAVYSIPEEMNKNEGAMVVACNPKYRGNGYIYNLVSRTIPKIKELNIRYLYWETDKSNKASSNIAKKFGFKPAKNFSKDDDNYVLDLNNYTLTEAMGWKESDDKIKSIKKIYYGLTETESKKKFLVYKGKNKGVNATLEGLIKFLKDNDMQDTITKYVILDTDQFNIDYSIKYDEKYDMFCIKTPFEFEIKNPKDIDYSISETYIEESVLIQSNTKIFQYSIEKKHPDKVLDNKTLKKLITLLNKRLTNGLKTLYYNLKKGQDNDLKIELFDLEKPSLNTFINSSFIKYINIDYSYPDDEDAVYYDKEVYTIHINIINPYLVYDELMNSGVYCVDRFQIYNGNIKFIRDKINSFHESVLLESKMSKKYYHVSQSNLDGKTLQPSIPNNYFTKNGYEDNKTKRVCFTNSIDNCLRALSQKCTGMELYVHILDGNYNVYTPSIDEVPDCKVTGEVWVTKPCKVKCIGKIKVIGDRGEDGLPFKYGDKTAELYDWNWKWIEQLSESKDASVIEDDFKGKSGKTFKLIDLNTKEALKYVSDKWQTSYRNTRYGRIAICKEDDKLAGYIYWNKSGTIGPLEIYKDYRGYRLSETLMKEAIKNGGNKLGVYSDNEVAIRLYKKLGFVETGRKKYKDGDEVIIMDLKSSLNESKNKSTLDDNFKKKKIDFKYYKLDINDSDAKKYLETNSFCKKYLNYISKNSGEILVDKDNDKLIGYIWVGKSKDRGLITGLDILNNYKGYGLSEILLKDAINNYGAIHLTVDPDNKIAIHLYEKFGFVIVNYYNDNSGEYYYMKLESKLNKKEKEDVEKFKLQNVSEAYTKELGKIQKDPEIIDSYGFISSDGIYNENVKIKGYNKWLRGRSELLIIDKGKVYLKKDPKKGYSIPGGGWEKDEDHNLSAIRETNEEARIKVKNVNYVSSYVAYFPPKDWVKEKISEENWWYGEYIELYIGEYNGQYKGKVDKIDQDKAMESGKFYDIKSIYNDLIPVHQEALSNIINEASISNYKFLDIKSNKSKALEYLKANSETKSYAEDTIKNYNGELVIYNDIMIGRILVGDKKDKGFITDFSIDEEHRGNRLGSKLIDDAINKYHGYDLLVDKDNKLALDMYKRRGFVIVKTYKNQYYMKLESKLKEDTIMMNEAMNALLTGYIPGSVDNPNNTYIVNYMQNNVFSGEDPNEDCIGVSSDPLFTNMIIRDKNSMLKRVDESFLKDKDYKVYIIEKSIDEVNDLISANIGNFVKYGYLYETLTGKKLYSKDQVGLEGVLIPVMDYYKSMDIFKEICDNYFFARDKKEESINESTFIPKEVRYFNNSGLMYIDKVYTLNGYINSKSNKVLEALDITIK